MPDDFIPLAEETGLILQIGEWGLETACAQLDAWSHREGTARLTIAVNISARHLRQPNFVEQALQFSTAPGPGLRTSGWNSLRAC